MKNVHEGKRKKGKININISKVMKEKTGIYREAI